MRGYVIGIVTALIGLYAWSASGEPCGTNPPTQCCNAVTGCGKVSCGGAAATCNCCYCGVNAVTKYICGDTTNLQLGCRDATLCGSGGQ
jgi:hypothetical protein